MQENYLKLLAKNIIQYIFPEKCANCSQLVIDGSSLCAECFQQLEFITAPYCQKCGIPFEVKIEGNNLCGRCIADPQEHYISRSLLKFDGFSKKLIHNFKYNDLTIYAKIFAKLIIHRYRDEIAGAEYVVPVPMNRFKRILRHYNPPQYLAQELATQLNIATIPDLLIKTKWTMAQTKLNKRQREQNLHNTIKYNEKYPVAKKIILVDDVRTTGATRDNCIKILKKQGVAQVAFITIAAT